MKPLSIRTRLTAWYSAVLAASLCMFGAVAYFAMSGSIRATVDSGLRARLEGVREVIQETTPEGLAAIKEELGEFSDVQAGGGLLWISDANGNLIYNSFGGKQPGEPARRMAASIPFYEKIRGEQFRVLSQPVEAAGSRYQVQIAVSTESFDRALDRFRLVLCLSAPLFLAVAALGGYWMSRRALAPVDEITRTARSISAQNLSRRLLVPQTADELERLSATLNEMLERLEAAFRKVAQFTADASHELRTPVAVMRTSAELALRKPRSESEYREAIQQILREAENTTRLIENLMLLTRADLGEATLSLERTNAAECLERASRKGSILAEAKQVAFSERVPEKPVWIPGDSSSLERLFLILLDNAVKYTPAGGCIDVNLRSQDGFAIAEIRDTGIGIAAEDLPRIFDRFYRADRARSRESGGTGLGLAIGRWIVEAHRGEIRVESEPAKGSRFEVRLPLSSEGGQD